MEMGMYVAVSDLAVAKKFYSQLFESEPYIENENFVGFQIQGGRFGLMRGDAYAVPLQRGNSAVPNIKVTDIAAEHRRVKSMGPQMIQEPIVDLGAMKLFMFKDPDGNVIEFFSTG